jgi:hypothetical protein
VILDSFVILKLIFAPNNKLFFCPNFIVLLVITRDAQRKVLGVWPPWKISSGKISKGKFNLPSNFGNFQS